MSTWIDVEDMLIDYETNEVHILVDSDDFGTNYVVVTWKQVEELHKKIFTPAEDPPGFEGTLEALDKLTIIKKVEG